MTIRRTQRSQSAPLLVHPLRGQPTAGGYAQTAAGPSLIPWPHIVAAVFGSASIFNLAGFFQRLDISRNRGDAFANVDCDFIRPNTRAPGYGFKNGFRNHAVYSIIYSIIPFAIYSITVNGYGLSHEAEKLLLRLANAVAYEPHERRRHPTCLVQRRDVLVPTDRRYDGERPSRPEQRKIHEKPGTCRHCPCQSGRRTGDAV